MENTETVENVDELLAGVEGKEPAEIPMDAPPPSPESQEYTLKVNGQEVKAKLDQVLKWAEMGHGAPNKIGELNKQLKQIQEQAKQYEGVASQYKPVDEYAKQNPQWWKHVMDQYQQRAQWMQQTQTQDPNNPVLQELSTLKEQLNDVVSFKQQLVEQQKKYTTQMEDKALDDQIQAVKKEFGDIPWQDIDMEGKSLEYKVLEHATKNGINSFRAAFRDYYFDEIQKRNMEKGKQAVANDMIKKTKLGILGESQTPTKGLSQTQNPKSKSYEMILDEAKRELGIA